MMVSMETVQPIFQLQALQAMGHQVLLRKALYKSLREKDQQDLGAGIT